MRNQWKRKFKSVKNSSKSKKGSKRRKYKPKYNNLNIFRIKKDRKKNSSLQRISKIGRLIFY